MFHLFINLSPSTKLPHSRTTRLRDIKILSEIINAYYEVIFRKVILIHSLTSMA